MRISNVTSRTGDQGSSSLADGSRLPKGHLIFEVLGGLDELNSHLGLLLSRVEIEHELRPHLVQIQNHLFDLGGILALPGQTGNLSQNSLTLEAWIEEYNTKLPPLEEFILPGGNQAAATTHLARAVCRRAERHLWQLLEQQDYPKSTAIYLNRLSDLLFIFARTFNRLSNTPEPFWQRE